MGYEKNEQIMALIKERGPILPVEAAKRVETDIIIASAYLATMVSRAEVRMSHLKIGGSPLYFLPGQESMLQNFADRLNPPERKTYSLLKERKLLRDAELEPVQRVSIRAIRDFALPLNVKHEGNVEVFWKWYLVSDAEAEVLIKNIFNPVPEEKPAPAAQPPPQKAPEPKTEPLAAKQDTEQEKEKAPSAPPEEPKPVPIQKKTEEKPKRKRAEKLRQEVLAAEPAEKPSGMAADEKSNKSEPGFGEPETKDKFFEEVKAYFTSNSIMVLESAIVKKNSELDLVVSVPSAVGRLTYYCKAKNKKKSNEGDLASAFVQGQSRKLPTLYLSRGDLVKKASEMLGREFRGIVVKTF